LPATPASDKINGADETSERREAGMPHWGLKMGLPDQLLVAISAALEDDFHPGDADRLLALGRALGLLGRLGFDEPEFLGAVQASRDVLASRVEAVLAEARQEAGDDPVDPRLLLALTEALAATFDPGYH
jgi:hypothetical protein